MATILVVMVLGLSLLCLVGAVSSIKTMRGTESESINKISIAVLSLISLACIYYIIPNGNNNNGPEVFEREPQDTASSLAEQYPGNWRSDAPNSIIQTLISNDVRGCGEFHHKPSAQNSGEYLVYCTRDGRTWTTYLVWPNVDRISGPARPDPSISPPR